MSGAVAENMREPVFDRVVLRAVSGQRVVTGPRHGHDDFELTWVEAGSVAFDLGRGRALEASAGACVVLPPDLECTPRVRVATLHQIMVSAPAVEAAAEALERRPRAWREPRVLGADERLAQLVRLYLQEAEAARAMSEPVVASLANAVVFGLARVDDRAATGDPAPDRRIRRALAAVAEGYRGRLSVDELAAAAGMSRFAFLHAFRAQTGASPYQYLTEFRLARAAEQLRAGASASVLQVALACGFTDPGRFARAFRARYGCTPRAFRARAAG